MRARRWLFQLLQNRTRCALFFVSHHHHHCHQDLLYNNHKHINHNSNTNKLNQTVKHKTVSMSGPSLPIPGQVPSGCFSCFRTRQAVSAARETAATATSTAIVDFWRWCPCWCWCSRAAGQAAPEDPQAAELMRYAIRSLDAALEAWGGRGDR